ncbi:MAG: hypothetical protein IJ849_04425 [Selenomonadaceae bacterium]|nr:hypothetical protein [Selenomonadaceae bacterium]
MSAIHGEGQQLKREILELIQSAADPFAIIYRVACRLEKESGEPGYAKYVEEQLRAVYGFALKHTRLIKDEIKDVEARLKLMEKNRDSGDFTAEEITRIDFAVEHHKENIKRLQAMLERAEAEGKPLTITEN